MKQSAGFTQSITSWHQEEAFFSPLHWQNGSSGPNNARTDIMALCMRGIKVTPAEMVPPTWHVSKGLEMKQILVFFFFFSFFFLETCLK